eukprot:TRINITY_DN4725_c0_g1_i2.p1 TRINITY_DN4725_c0_g1~~TRINITY_DN4725_c0_g1_i2.p1  ORF type:complete len:279 (-),score=91.46 TRINITY_DN4725_c0_g1_i2:55-831(-)
MCIRDRIYSGGAILKFLLGFIPFIMAYALLGLVLFWKYEKFDSVSNSLVTLFALSNGDAVYETFDDVSSEGSFGKMFLITYILLFFTSFQNVFILIIMEGYEISRIVKKYEWANLNSAETRGLVEKLREEYKYEEVPQTPMASHRREDGGSEHPLRKSNSHPDLRVADPIEEEEDEKLSHANDDDYEALDFKTLEEKLRANSKKVLSRIEELKQIYESSKDMYLSVADKEVIRKEYEKHLDYIFRKLKYKINNYQQQA